MALTVAMLVSPHHLDDGERVARITSTLCDVGCANPAARVVASLRRHGCTLPPRPARWRAAHAAARQPRRDAHTSCLALCRERSSLHRKRREAACPAHRFRWSRCASPSVANAQALHAPRRPSVAPAPPSMPVVGVERRNPQGDFANPAQRLRTAHNLILLGLVVHGTLLSIFFFDVKPRAHA